MTTDAIIERDYLCGHTEKVEAWQMGIETEGQIAKMIKDGKLFFAEKCDHYACQINYPCPYCLRYRTVPFIEEEQ